MPLFSYRATDSAGQTVTGEINAPDERRARADLAELGLTSIQFSGMAEAHPPSVTISQPMRIEDAEEIVLKLAQASSIQGPLADGLRAAAAEGSSRRVASSLRYLAREIDRGRSPFEVLADAKIQMPSHVRGLVAAAIRTGRLGPALDELIEHHRSLRQMFWTILASLAYPLLVLVVATLVFAFFLGFVVPQFEELFLGMELRLPMVTASLIHASQTVNWLVAGPAKWAFFVVILGAMLAIYLTASGRGGARVQRFLEMMPVIGPLWAWAGTSGFMHLLASLLDENVPLPEALRLTADGMRKADLRKAGYWLASGIQSGQSLSELVEKSHCLPATTVPVLRWGEQTGVLAEAARTLSELFAERVSARATWLRSASPPVVYILVLITLGFAITSLFLPLVSLIQGLA